MSPDSWAPAGLKYLIIDVIRKSLWSYFAIIIKIIIISTTVIAIFTSAMCQRKATKSMLAIISIIYNNIIFPTSAV